MLLDGKRSVAEAIVYGALEIVEALPGLLRELGATSVRDIIGTLQMPT